MHVYKAGTLEIVVQKTRSGDDELVKVEAAGVNPQALLHALSPMRVSHGECSASLRSAFMRTACAANTPRFAVRGRDAVRRRMLAGYYAVDAIATTGVKKPENVSFEVAPVSIADRREIGRMSVARNCRSTSLEVDAHSQRLRSVDATYGSVIGRRSRA